MMKHLDSRIHTHTHTLLDYAERLIYSDEPDPILILISRAEITASGVYKTEKLFT